MANYTADPAHFVKAFPARIERPPDLLLDFAAWLRTRPWGSVGSFDLTAGWSDHNLVAGERVYGQFALFMRMPDGSLVGYWLKDGASTDLAPIVWFGSHGDFETLAPDLPHFLARLAIADFGDKGAGADFLHNDYQDAPDLRSELAKWVANRLGLGGVGRLKGWRPQGQDAFKTWAEAASLEAEEALARDPDIVALTRILEPYRPKTRADPWSSTTIFVGWAGDHVEIVDASHGHKPIDEREQALPHVAALRDGEAGRTPGVGLWNHAWFNLFAEGAAEYRTEYIHEPRFFHGRPPRRAYRADQARAPRTPRRIPDWLGLLLED